MGGPLPTSIMVKAISYLQYRRRTSSTTVNVNGPGDRRNDLFLQQEKRQQ